MATDMSDRLMAVQVINAKGRSVEGRSGLNTQLRNASQRPLPEPEVREFLKRSSDFPPDAKVIMLDQVAKIPDRESRGKIRVKWISRYDEGYSTLDGSIQDGFFVLAETHSSWRANRWGR